MLIIVQKAVLDFFVLFYRIPPYGDYFLKMRVTVLFYFVVILVISESRFLLKVGVKLMNLTSNFFVLSSYECHWNKIELKQSFYIKLYVFLYCEARTKFTHSWTLMQLKMPTRWNWYWWSSYSLKSACVWFMFNYL